MNAMARSLIRSRRLWRFVLILLPAMMLRHAAAQAPINFDVAMQPSKGGLILRQQFRYAEADFRTAGGKLEFRQVTSSTTAVFGLTDDITLLLNMPAVLSSRAENRTTGVSDTNAGLADLTFLGKWRVFRDDSGPSDTLRFDLVGGAELPTGEDAFTSDSFDPIVGGLFTLTHGRHFFDMDLLWKANTAGGPAGADLLRYDAAYIYRLWPEQYVGPDPSSLNGVLELNGFSETNGDNELFLSPGIQYITRRWIAEVTVQIPVWQNLEHRPETKFVIGVSLRIQF